MTTSTNRPLIVAALGDVHGELDAAVEILRQAERAAEVAIDLVLQVGDFEPHRHPGDLASMYAPNRQKRLGDFPAYAQGKKRFPWPLYFIGGNHEPYGLLLENPEGRILAENIHFLGFAGKRHLMGLEVAFLSGIYDEGHYSGERPTRFSATPGHAAQHALTCYTAHDLERLSDVSQAQVLLLHEWPLGLVRAEDHETGEPRHRRLRWGETGVPLLRALVERMAPTLVLCGHVHRRYRGQLMASSGKAVVVHCLGRGNTKEGSALFAFDGKQLEEITATKPQPPAAPNECFVNERLAEITYPSTHQYTVGEDQVHPAASAQCRLRELESVLPARPWQSLIDIGCGKGMFLLWAWQRFGLKRLVGLDDSQQMARAARLAAAHLRAPADILHGPPSEFRAALAPADLVFMLHCYHYLYFGSLSGSPGVASHAWWFDFLANIATDTLVFSNPLVLDEKRIAWFRQRGATEAALAAYCPEAIIAAAERHFAVTHHPLGGGRPYLVMRRLERPTPGAQQRH